MCQWQNGATNIGPVLMTYMYGICCVPFFFIRKTARKNIFFKSLPKTNGQMVNLECPDWI